MVEIPTAFAERRIAVSGEAGRRWIASLDDQVAYLCNAWGLTIAGAPMTGELGLVLPVVRGVEQLALKVSWPDRDSEDEALALSTWNGCGAIQLLAADPRNNALLLERADHTRPLSAIPINEAVDIAGHLLRRLAVAPPAGLRSLGRVAASLETTMPEDWHRLGRPFSVQLLDEALGYLDDRLDPSEQLLINTDLHYDNVLAANREPWLVIDPKVITGEVEFGIAPLLWNLYGRVDVGALTSYFDRLIEVAGCNPERARRWTVIRMVDYWLWALDTGLTEDPRMCRIIIDILI